VAYGCALEHAHGGTGCQRYGDQYVDAATRDNRNEHCHIYANVRATGADRYASAAAEHTRRSLRRRFARRWVACANCNSAASRTDQSRREQRRYAIGDANPLAQRRARVELFAGPNYRPAMLR
jgi:hypothetical protein